MNVILSARKPFDAYLMSSSLDVGHHERHARHRER
jgi:hypothetical protein